MCACDRGPVFRISSEHSRHRLGFPPLNVTDQCYCRFCSRGPALYMEALVLRSGSNLRVFFLMSMTISKFAKNHICVSFKSSICIRRPRQDHFTENTAHIIITEIELLTSPFFTCHELHRMLQTVSAPQSVPRNKNIAPTVCTTQELIYSWYFVFTHRITESSSLRHHAESSILTVKQLKPLTQFAFIANACASPFFESSYSAT